MAVRQGFSRSVKFPRRVATPFAGRTRRYPQIGTANAAYGKALRPSRLSTLGEGSE